MSATEVHASDQSPDATVKNVDLKLEVVVIPVSDVDRAKEFYGRLGWRLDADFSFDNGVKVVQFTPPGSPGAIQFGTKMTSAAPGSAENLYLVVSDIEAARDELIARGAEVSEVFHAGAPGAQFQPDGASDRRARARRPTTPATARSRRSATRTATAGCCRRSRPGFPDASTRPRRRSPRRTISRARCGGPRPPTASMSSAPDSATRTGPTGTPRTWRRSRPANNCRRDAPRPQHSAPRHFQLEEFAMSTTDAGPSSNGRVSEAWSQSWTHLSVDRRSPSYCRVTFDHPPINTITATTVAELAELVGLIEQDPDLNVVVFDSANPDFYLAHYDVENDPGKTAALGVGPTGMPAWLDLLARLSRAPVVSIASIRGRARGAGSEFILACDLRFASRENTLLGQFEVGIGVVPGGAPMARLSRLVGRGRALEILLVADDLDGPRAEQYGYVNRVIADDQLDTEVDTIAARLARFDHDAIARTKSHVDRVTLPADSELPPATADFRELFARPAQQTQWARLQELGLNTDSDLERSLGRRVLESLPDA